MPTTKDWELLQRKLDIALLPNSYKPQTSEYPCHNNHPESDFVMIRIARLQKIVGT
jgi:hypothetical protein